MLTTDRRCFIISAFGRDDAPPGSELRVAWERASSVISALIAPAIDRANAVIVARGEPPLTYHRGDYTRDTRPIIDDIHNNILNATINIAVLLMRNDNVGYEIGVAHAFGRPVILLRHEDFAPPYDLERLRMIHFRDAAFVEGPHRDEVLQILVETILTKVPSHAANNFEPSLLGGDSVPLARCISYDRFRPPYAEWDRMFWQTEREVWVAGTTLDQVAGVNKFRRPVDADDEERLGLAPMIDGVQQYVEAGLIEGLMAQCMAGRDVNVLIMHEDNPALPELLRHPTRRHASEIRKVHAEIANTSDRVAEALDRLVHRRRVQGEPIGTFTFTKVLRGLLANRVSMSDAAAYITPISFTLDLSSGPCFLVAPLSPTEAQDRHGRDYGDINLFGVTHADLRFLQRINPTIRLNPDGSLRDDLNVAEARGTG